MNDVISGLGSTPIASSTGIQNVSSTDKSKASAQAQGVSYAQSVAKSGPVQTSVSSLPTLPDPGKVVPSTYPKVLPKVVAASGHVHLDIASMLEALANMDLNFYKTERSASAAELTVQLNAMDSKAKSLKKEAAAELAAGIVKGAFEIGAAAVNFAGAAKIGKAIGGDMSDTEINTLTMKINLQTSGLSQGVNAVGTIGSSIASYEGQMQKVDQVNYDKQATKAQAMRDAFSQNMQQVMGTFEAVNNGIHSIVDINHEVAEKSMY